MLASVCWGSRREYIHVFDKKEEKTMNIKECGKGGPRGEGDGRQKAGS